MIVSTSSSVRVRSYQAIHKVTRTVAKKELTIQRSLRFPFQLALCKSDCSSAIVNKTKLKRPKPKLARSIQNLEGEPR
jgi:dephospho-CoA kinase